MPTLLFINACVRGKDSRTLALCERLLTSIKEANQKDMAFKIEEIRLSTENLIPMRTVCLTMPMLWHRQI